MLTSGCLQTPQSGCECESGPRLQFQLFPPVQNIQHVPNTLSAQPATKLLTATILSCNRS